MKQNLILQVCSNFSFLVSTQFQLEFVMFIYRCRSRHVGEWNYFSSHAASNLEFWDAIGRKKFPFMMHTLPPYANSLCIGEFPRRRKGRHFYARFSVALHWTLAPFPQHLVQESSIRPTWGFAICFEVAQDAMRSFKASPTHLFYGFRRLDEISWNLRELCRAPSNVVFRHSWR
jgi:hypothetical protein